MTADLKTIVITGASGFIGVRLVAKFLNEQGYAVRVLSRSSRKRESEAEYGPAVTVHEGDLAEPESLKGLLVPGSTVVNLVYQWNSGAELNRACMQNLSLACCEAGVRRLIHCSTAAVVGRVSTSLVDENTQCMPITEYGMTKLAIERDLVDFSITSGLDAVILRPTSVFGIHGEPLKMLASDLVHGRRWKNYLKSCLFGGRKMNLVPVANVIAAIEFLVRCTERFQGEIFIVSSDEDSKNNFRDIEELLMLELGVEDYWLPRVPVPLPVLEMLLVLLRRNNVNPLCEFDSGKLRKMGFNGPVRLIDGVSEYAKWFRTAGRKILRGEGC